METEKPQETEEVKTSEEISLHNPLSHLPSIIAFLFIYFLFSGITYHISLFGAFNIELSNYFTINDYISSSISEIYFVICLLFMIIIPLIFKQKYPAICRLLFLFLLFLSYVLMSFFAKYKFEIITIITSVYLMLIYFLSKDSHKKYALNIAKDITIKHGIFILVLGLLLIGIRANQNASSIKHSPVTEIKQNIYVKSSDFDNVSTVMILCNSNYCFFYDKENEMEIIVPKDNILTIEVNRAVEN